MHPTSRTSCSLHVLVTNGHAPRSDLRGLVTTLAGRLEEVTVVAWAPSAVEVDLASIERAADVVDRLEDLTGARPAYVECHGDLERHLDDHRPNVVQVVALAVGAPASLVRSVRRAAARSASHVAMLPSIDMVVGR